MIIPGSLRYSPVGEYLRLVVMRRLAKGPATVEEIDELARRAVEGIGIGYDWRVWQKLLEREVMVKDGVAELTKFGEMMYRETRQEIEEYLKRWRLL